MLLFLFTPWPDIDFISLTGCRFNIFIVGEMDQCWGHCSELWLKASHLLLNLFLSPLPVFRGDGYWPKTKITRTDTAPPQGGWTHSAGEREQFSKLEELWGEVPAVPLRTWSESWICSGCSALTTEWTQKTPEGLQNRMTTLVGENM